MPEANVLYSVTAAVVLGLVTWVAVVLKTAKEPWARELPKPARADDDVPLETAAAADEMTSEGAPLAAKAEAAEEKAEAEAEADAKADAKAEEKADAGEKADAEEKADAKADAEEKADVDEKKADAKA